MYCTEEKIQIHIAIKGNRDFKCNLNVYFFTPRLFSCKIYNFSIKSTNLYINGGDWQILNLSLQYCDFSGFVCYYLFLL